MSNNKKVETEKVVVGITEKSESVEKPAVEVGYKVKPCGNKTKRKNYSVEGRKVVLNDNEIVTIEIVNLFKEHMHEKLFVKI